MIATLLLAVAQPQAPAPDCSYDLDAMLELDQQAFDQDPNGGWRPLAAKEGCEIAAGELIRAWRHEKRDNRSLLYWHEGQMRAFGGQTAEAVDLFQLTYKPPEFDHDFGWNYYVSGSVAFLLGDREHLGLMIEKLRAVEKPDDAPEDMTWPPNLNVLEAFDRCWGKTYAEAYGSQECRTPAEATD